METMTHTTQTRDYFEYHGNTAIEMTRRESGYIIKRDWLIFDTVEEAQAFYYDNCCENMLQ